MTIYLPQNQLGKPMPIGVLRLPFDTRILFSSPALSVKANPLKRSSAALEFH